VCSGDNGAPYRKPIVKPTTDLSLFDFSHTECFVTNICHEIIPASDPNARFLTSLAFHPMDFLGFANGKPSGGLPRFAWIAQGSPAQPSPAQAIPGQHAAQPSSGHPSLALSPAQSSPAQPSQPGLAWPRLGPVLWISDWIFVRFLVNF